MHSQKNVLEYVYVYVCQREGPYKYIIKYTIDTYHQNYLARKQGATAGCMFQLTVDRQRLQN